MTTHYGGMGCAVEDRILNSHREDTGNIDENESTNSSESTIAFGGSEAGGCLSDLLSSGQADLKIFTRKVHSL